MPGAFHFFFFGPNLGSSISENVLFWDTKKNRDSHLCPGHV